MSEYTSDADWVELTPVEQKEAFSSDSDWGQPTQPDRTYRINKAKSMGKGESFATGAGHALNRAKNALEEAWLKMRGRDQEVKDLQKVMDMEDAAWADMTSEWNPKAGWLKGGDLTGEVLPGLVSPLPNSKSMAVRALLNAAYGGAYEGLTTRGSIGDRMLAGTVGATGAGAGSLLGDLAIKKLTGKLGQYTQPKAVEKARRLRTAGFEPRIGDVAQRGTASVIRKGEDLIADTPLGSTGIGTDVEKLRRAVVPANETGENAVVSGIKGTEKGIQTRADQIWDPFKQYVAQNAVPGVRPYNLRVGLEKIIQHDKNFLNDISDDVLRGRLEALLSTPRTKLPAISPDDYVELNSALSSLTPFIKSRSQPAPGATVLGDAQGYRRFAEHIMDGMRKDMDTWKTFKGAKQAADLLDESMNAWKREILPWKQSDTVYGLNQIERFGAPETARLLSGNPDIQATNLVREYMKRLGPYDSEIPVDALLSMDRQGRKLSNLSEEMTGTDLLTGAFGAPLALLSRKPGIQDWYFGDPMVGDLTADSARRVMNSLGREFGLEAIVAEEALNSLLGGSEDGGLNSDEPGVGIPISSANQMGVQGR
jgi:hypothetical protein